MKSSGKAAFFFLFLFLIPNLLSASDDLYDAPGLDANRETLSSIPNEHIDPFTGGLTLTFTDMKLPGNGGLDLAVQRTYNSKNACQQWTNWQGQWSCSKRGENTWLGYGWTLHFGRLFKSTNLNGPHLVEMPDGSRHAAYSKPQTSVFITKDYWVLDLNANPSVLTLTNGTKIFFAQNVANNPDYPKHTLYHATKIEDVNSNQIKIFYAASGSSEVDYLIDTVGRRIEFTTAIVNGAKRLVSISGPGVSISYAHKALPQVGSTLLTKAMPPVGNPWEYGYDEFLLELTSLSTPFGGVIGYGYGVAEINTGFSFYYRTVVQKETSGRIGAGTWTLSYSQGDSKDYTEVNDPCGRIHKYSYYGFGNRLPNGSMWQLGLPRSKEVVGEETVTYDWVNSSAISWDNYKVTYAGEDDNISVPLQSRRTITRNSKTYTTSYDNYDNYGNPRSITETGDETRNRSLGYWYHVSKNIVRNKFLSETIGGSLPGSFTTTYRYDSNNGNLLQMSQHGIETEYAYDSNGNLLSLTDANGNTTSYEWANGKISKVKNPLYSISKVINPNGTLASETNGRGFITTFTYDRNLRLTKIVPPVGNPTLFTYPPDNSYKKETRGQYYTYHNINGLGQPTGTSDIKGITTQVIYKSCGLKDYSGSNVGDLLYYDNFGRVRQITHKDTKKITYLYSQSDVTVTDETGNKTYYTYVAFGTPDEKLLMGVEDPLGSQTTYDYNILGSLTDITQNGLPRNYTYNSKNYLISESHPEKGTVVYTRDEVGNLKTKTDGLGTTTYAYDTINRLTQINDAVTPLTFTYDNSDNRTRMLGSKATMVYTYDGSNRLVQKDETILGVKYMTKYIYDRNDNVKDITYPSGRVVNHTYNAKNQVTSLTGAGWSIRKIIYHTTGTAIGLPKSFLTSNSITARLTYNQRNLATLVEAGPFVLDMNYTYDTRGNMLSMTDTLDSSGTQTFTYDQLNRLLAFNGPWGAGAYTYDPTGNRLSKTVGGAPTAYNYTQNRLVSTTGAEQISFNHNTDGDADFMMTQGQGYDLDYDGFHNLISYKKQDGTPIATFAYDGDGMRVTKTSSGKTVVYHYDREGKVLSETDEAGTPTTEYIHLHGKLIAKIDASGVYFYHTDPAGTPLAMTDGTGRLVWKAQYKPFGEEQELQEAVENDQRFVGKKKDKETGLLYFGARYMETRIGRFISIDPVGAVDAKTGKIDGKSLHNPQRFNRYAYSLNNPYRYIDPDGKWPEAIHNRIIRAAFPNLPRNLRTAIERGSASVDRDQSMEGSYKHAMRAPGQAVEETKNQMNNFIAGNAKEYRTLMSQGKTEEAYFRLGEAMHPIMDSTSPSHKGFQVWEGTSGPQVLGEAIIHVSKESTISNEHLNRTKNLIREFYDKNK